MRSPRPHLLTVGLLLGLAAASLPAGEVRTGDPEARVLEEFGAPKGRMKQKGVETFFYEGGTVQLRDGRVVAMDGGMTTRARQRSEQAEPERQQAAGRETAPATAGPTAQPPPSDRLKVIRRDGARIELTELLAPNRITVVDFFADWCGPCRALSPHLATLVSQDPDVVVCQVDMVRWDSPVARQYDLHSVPNLRVYDRSGRMIGQPTSNFRAVLDSVARAKQAR